MTNRVIAPTLTLLALALAVPACTSGRDPSKKKKDPAAKTESKAEAKADGEAADKPVNADAKAEAKAVEAKKPSRFREGQPIPRDLSEEELHEYAEAQGDPMKGQFTLEQALAGDETLADKEKGQLTAVFKTSMGDFECDLYEEKAPKTVANFVGLARGTRPWKDPETNEWVKDKPFFDGVIFHRVIDNFMIQTGDRTGSGTGGPGYHIVDEFDPSLKHTGKGMLSMANRGPNTGSSQFFVTVAPTPHLNGKHAIFGKCDPKVPVEISKVKTDPRQGNRPYERVEIKTIEIKRK